MDPDNTLHAIESASERGWEAVALVILFLAMVAGAGIMLRWVLSRLDKENEESRQREEHLSQRLSEVERFCREELATALQNSSDANKHTASVVERLANIVERLSLQECPFAGKQNKE